MSAKQTIDGIVSPVAAAGATKSRSTNIDISMPKKLDKAANSAQSERNVIHAADSEDTDFNWWSTELRNRKFLQLLNSSRQQLNPFEKIISKLIHSETSEMVGDVIAKSALRPSGLIGGGLVSFLVSAVSYFAAHQVNGDIKPGVFLISFMAGYISGVAGEIVCRVIARLRI